MVYDRTLRVQKKSNKSKKGEENEEVICFSIDTVDIVVRKVPYGEGLECVVVQCFKATEETLAT